MKVTNSWWQTSIALHSSTLSGGYKNQCKQMWTFLEVFICGKNMFVQHHNQPYFLLSFTCYIVVYFAIHHCLL